MGRAYINFVSLYSLSKIAIQKRRRVNARRRSVASGSIRPAIMRLISGLSMRFRQCVTPQQPCHHSTTIRHVTITHSTPFRNTSATILQAD